MKVLWKELMKIARQLRGSENIFGCKSTVANQLFLFYCFGGKIYFTDKIHQRVKYLWYGIVLCQILFSFVISSTYLWYGIAENDIVMMFNVVNAIGSIHMTALGIPSILYLYSDRIESMIDHVDGILTSSRMSDSKQEKVRIDAKNNLVVFLGLCVMFMAINLSICFLDIVLFFDEAKVKNYLYYPFPVFLFQKYHNIGSFFIFNGVATIIFVFVSLESWMVLSMLSYWSTVWCSELISLRDELNTGMNDLNAHFGENYICLNDWNESFENILKYSVERFIEIASFIRGLKGLIELYGAVLISTVYCYNIFFLYNGFSNISAVLVVKNLTAALACIVLVLLFYWIGQNLENSVSELSMAIYSTPWYRSTKVRKNVYIFLCHTQSVKTFTIFKVYKLLLSNFSRYMHGLVSYTNILRRLAKK